MKHTTDNQSPSPPRWAEQLLEWRCPDFLLEEVQGDLHERFEERLAEVGLLRARRQYILDVLGFLRPFAFKKQVNQNYPANQMAMLSNYLKIAFRNLQRNQAYAFINVMGLALGMACGILIFTLVKYHLSFDTFHPNADRIYRFVTEIQRDRINYAPNVPSPLGKAFRNDYTFAEKVARVATIEPPFITVHLGKESKKFRETEVAFAETEFFDIFHHPLLQGSKKTALTEPHTAILTEKIAKKYFGDENPLNKTFRLNNRIDFRVTGILADVRRNTDLKTEIYLSYNTLKQYNEWLASDDSWGGITSEMKCYTLLKPSVKPADVEKVLPAYVKKYRPQSKNIHHYHLQPLADVHFDTRYGGSMEKKNLWVLSLIGLFLILTACVNFINLATAQALNRSREVGVRKVLGSLPIQLFWQFIAETGLITSFAVLMGYGLARLFLPYLNDWFNAQMTIDLYSDGQLLVFIPLLALGVTFFSGSYPGLILARFQPVLALKGQLTQKSLGSFSLRRALIVSQFAISQMLVIGMIVIASQMRYAKQSDLGFNKEAIVMLPAVTDSSGQTMNTLRNQLSQVSGVENVSLCFTAPASGDSWNTIVKYDTRTEEEDFRISIRAADEQYVPLFGLKLVAGRNILPSDTVKEFLVNETFARKLNLHFPQEVIGKKIAINGGAISAPIVGVVKDFHDKSFREDIDAVCMLSKSDLYRNYAVKINLAHVKTTLAALERAWSAMHPDQQYEYQFLDDRIAKFYETEELMLKLIQAFAAMAIFIGCLGLYGLVAFMAARKTKEIGIRKVLGAHMGSLLWLFGKEFSLLIGIAFLVAAPLSWYVMNRWLENFAYRIDLGIGVFLLAMAVTIIIALLTVGYRAVKAALANPVKSLRAE